MRITDCFVLPIFNRGWGSNIVILLNTVLLMAIHKTRLKMGKTKQPIFYSPKYAMHRCAMHLAQHKQ